jgi:hypothetical protein
MVSNQDAGQGGGGGSGAGVPVPNPVEVIEVQADDSISSAYDANQATAFVKTGLTGGKRFLVKIHNPGKDATMIALHL